MVDCGGEEVEKGAQHLLGVSKSAESGLVPDLKAESVLPMFSSRSFIVSGLTFNL